MGVDPLEGMLESFQASANHASLVQSRVKLLARLVRVPPPVADPKALPLAFVEAQPVYFVATAPLSGDKVLLGSDFPFDMGTDDPLDALRAVKDLPDPHFHAVRGGNAAALLRLT